MAIPIGIILVLVGVSAVLTASWFGPPLAKLSQAARDLGAGNLAARANLRRNDELGEVAVAFDEMAERVAQVVQSQRELLANVSHELRTPLARIRVALDLAAEGDAQEAASSLREIAGDLGELERLVADVLTTARLALSSETASPLQPPLRSERIDARQLLEQAVARFRATHPDRELTLEFSTPDAPLDADLMLLRRAIDNLLDNAAKHSETRAAVALAAAIDDGRLRIEIRDQGTGIPAADLKRLFTPFFRADRSRTRQTGGLGLGLVLARRIVEAHRGSLEVESFPGRGTVARILVPLAS
jgi:signal transduction histidine kinase